MKKACNECPFRKDSIKGWLGGYTIDQLHLFVMSENHFPCHMSLKEEIEVNEANKFPRCFGSLLYMKKNYKFPSDKNLQEIFKQFTKEELEQILNMFEFRDHHSPFKKL